MMSVKQKPTTRRSTRCPVFGAPKEMSDVVLPTYEDMMKNFLWWKHMMKPTIKSPDPTVADISEKVALAVENLWRKASIPMVSHFRVLQLIRSYHDKYMKLLKPFKVRKMTKTTRVSFTALERKVKECYLTFLLASVCQPNVTALASVRFLLQNARFWLIRGHYD